MSQNNPTPPEQMLYANILQIGCYTGLAMLCITFVMYMLGVFEPHVPVEKVVANWHLSVGDYLAATNSPSGWDWAVLLGKGDFMNFAGLALLALLTIVCYFVLIPGYIKNGDKIYAFIVIAEIIVLSLAATGLLGSGGH